MFSFVTKATSEIDPSTPSTTKPNPTRFTVSHAQLSIIVTLKCIERIRILLAAKIREDSRFISMDRAETDAQRNGFPAEENVGEACMLVHTTPPGAPRVLIRRTNASKSKPSSEEFDFFRSRLIVTKRSEHLERILHRTRHDF